MDNLRKKYEKISFRVTTGEKDKLQRMAELSGKSLAEYVRNAALSLTLDTAKINFYQSIVDDLFHLKEKEAEQKKDLTHLKRYQYAMVRLLIVIGSGKPLTQEKTTELFKSFLAEAKKKIDKE